jgi:GH15 family glucan-1,4-alpha-glucosidase
MSGSEIVPPELLSSVDRVARYLSAFAMSPCYDVWEENGEARHTSTLACVYGGLLAAARLLGEQQDLKRAEEVQASVSKSAANVGFMAKSTSNGDVDASSLWLSAPFGLVETGDEYFAATVALIEDRLTFEGGIRRYPTDVYFGSGAWPVLTGSLGWHYLVSGDLEGAERCRNWIEDQLDDGGLLGEQFGGDRRDPEHYRTWVKRWGQPAQDLTWSHAMYVILSLAIDNHDASRARPVLFSPEGRT